MNGYRKNVEYKNVFLEYAKLLNGYLQLTDRELQFFSYLLRFEVEHDSNIVPLKDVLSTNNRKYIRQETYISKNNLTKYASILRSKGILERIDDTKRHQVNPKLVPEVTRDDNGNYVMATQFILVYKKDEISNRK